MSYQDTGEATGEQLAMYPQQSSCILWKMQSVTIKPNKTLLLIKHRRNKSLDILPTIHPKIATKPQNYIEQMNGSAAVLSMNPATSLWSSVGLSLCFYIKTPSNFRFSKQRILSQSPLFQPTSQLFHGVFWTWNICF